MRWRTDFCDSETPQKYIQTIKIYKLMQNYGGIERFLLFYAKKKQFVYFMNKTGECSILY